MRRTCLSPISFKMDIHPADDLHFEANKELARRAKGSGFIYVALFLIIGFSMSYASSHYSLMSFTLMAILFLSSSLLRFRIAGRLTLENQKSWERVFVLSILSSSFLWGLFAAHSIFKFGVNTYTLLAVFATGGIAGGSSTSLGLSLRLMRWHLFFLVFPLVVTLGLSHDPGAHSMAIMVGIFLVVLLIQAKSVYYDYRSLLKKNILIVKKNQELSDANRKVLDAAQVKSQFLANMSHEIRTPMNGILSCTNFLSEKMKDNESQKLIDTIQSCGDSLMVIINDILDFSKLEAGKIELEEAPFNLSYNVENIVDLMRGKASENGAVIDFHIADEVPAWVLGDVTRWRQVITNLVSNAIKFTKSQVDVFVQLIPSEKVFSKQVHQEGESSQNVVIEFVVVDNGIGISREGQKKLFQDFAQVDASTTRKFGGTGLGLSISRGIVERMGGKIWVESEEGKGAQFHVSIPFEIADNQEVQKIIAENEGRTKSPFAVDPEMAAKLPLKILVAEDNSVNQMVIRTLLSKLGYQAEIVSDGLQALKALEEQHYDVVLMDQHMPIMDGTEATKKIRASSKVSPQVKIIALTASAFKEDRDRCLASGMNSFLSKPLQTQELIAALMEGEALSLLPLSSGQPIPIVASQGASDKKPEDLSPKPFTYLNVEELTAQFEGALEILDEVIREFLKTLPESMDAILQSIQNKDPVALEKSAHRLKGTLANFAVHEGVDLAKKLEVMGHQAQMSGAESTFQGLEEYINQLKADFEAFLELESADSGLEAAEKTSSSAPVKHSKIA